MASVREMITKFTFHAETAPLEKIEKSLDQIKERLEFLAAAEVLKGVFELTEKFAKFGEEIHLAAQAAGVTVEAFQKMSYAAQKSGVSQDEMGAATYRLQRKLYEAKQGNAEALKSFQQAGISGAQLQGMKNAGDAMLVLSDKFKGFGDTSKSAAIGTELMGRGSQRMTVFLAQGSAQIKAQGVELEKLGGVLSEHQIEGLVEMEHAFQKLWAIVKAVAATIASYFAPEVKAIVEDITHFYQVNQKVIQQNIKQWVGDFAYGLGFIMGILEGVIGVFLKWIQSHQTLARRISEIVVALGILAAIIFFVGKGVSLVSGAFGMLQSAMSGVMTVVEFMTTGFGLVLTALTLVVVAIHDLWEVAHGRPGWINSFIEAIGIGKEVEAVFFAIFEAIQDIMTLNFSKLWGDILGDIKGVYDWVIKIADGIGKWFGIGEGGGGKKGPEEAKADNGPGFFQKAANFLLPGVTGSSTPAGVEQVQQSLGALNPQAPAAIAAPQDVQGDVNTFNYSLNPNINISVPAGTSREDVSKAVQVGVKEHLDRVQREAQRSLLSPIKH